MDTKHTENEMLDRQTKQMATLIMQYWWHMLVSALGCAESAIPKHKYYNKNFKPFLHIDWIPN